MRTRMVIFLLGLIFSTQNYSGVAKKQHDGNKSVFKNIYDHRLVGVKTTGYASHRRLCGINEQLGADTFEYSSECCQEVDNKCVSTKQCRTPVAVCRFVRSDGEDEIYTSRGARECGQCRPVDGLEPSEVTAPY